MRTCGLKFALMAGVAAPTLAVATPALAQDAQLGDTDIIVTARRTEERLQDVPISITVFTGDQIEKRNIAVASDLAAFTPSLSVNTRFGPEKATFALRGFNQDGSTAPTVGVYFADVVGVRAQGGTAGGNTVPAGAFTDLQNVQVLKGPQGTLFGRNTTGGAVLLVPTKPSDFFGGYVEGTYGNFDQQRLQAAVNVPLAETFKVRVSVDKNKRDGYMRNLSGIGPDDYNDVDYTYARLSIVGNLTPELENYTIAHWSRSETNGYATRHEACDRNAVSPLAGGSLTYYFTSQASCDQIDRQAARGDGPHDVEVSHPNPRIFLRTWQVINTTTWDAADWLTVKNIASYGEYREESAFALYSDNFTVPNTTQFQLLNQFAGTPAPGTPFQYIDLATMPGHDAAAESTLTEELQFQGRSADGKLNFVVGGYLEFSRPINYNQQRTGIYGYCPDPGVLNCEGGIIPVSAIGGTAAIISESRTKLSFDNHGIFAQGTYNFTDQFALTVGGRYTFDKVVGYSESNRYTLGYIPALGMQIPLQRVCNDNLNHPAPGAPNATPTNTVNLLANGGDTSACGTTITNKSNKPTWLVGLDFKPTMDTLLYAKYARGYRQGGVNFTNPGLETWEPEKVDSYELGAKLTFRGSLPGYLNIAAFYNDFRNQQIFGSLIAKPNSGLSGGAAIINAGQSELKGVEVDAGVTIARMLRLGLGYTYLDTKLKELTAPVLEPNSPFAQIIPRGTVGDPLTYSPKNRVTASADLMLPVPDSVGEVTLGAIYTYTDKQFVDGNSEVPAYSLLNLNLAWNNIAQSGIDVVGFAQNVLDKNYRVTAGGAFSSAGILDFAYGPPRMYGVRVRFNFGD